ncbi:MAG: hypothetical protein K2O24_03220 [Muribaculaceae bacterium]|nr:hypothetical protein [Muribaculaceae bacterium]
MKKIYGFMAAAVLAAGLTGCGTGDDPVSLSNVSRTMLNHIAPINGVDDVVVSKGEYYMQFDNVKKLVSVSSKSIRYDNTDHSFSTTSMTFKAGAYNVGGYIGQVFRWQSAEGNVAATGSVPVTGFKGLMTDVFYFNNMLDVPVLGPMLDTRLSRTVLSYNYNNLYKITTFYPDMMFSGETSTTASATAEPFKTSAPQYRVVIDWEKKKASMVIYQAQFDPHMPAMTALLLQNLDVEWTRSGYTITGENVTAGSVENGSVTPVPGFPFTEIKMTTTSADMTEATVEYTVAGRFHGLFKGSYVWIPQD